MTDAIYHRTKARAAYEARCALMGRTPKPYKPTGATKFELPDGTFEVVDCYCGGPVKPLEVYSTVELRALRKDDLIPEGAIITSGGNYWQYTNMAFVPAAAQTGGRR